MATLSDISARKLELSQVIALLLEDFEMPCLLPRITQSLLNVLSFDRLYREGFLNKDLDSRIIHLILMNYYREDSYLANIALLLWPHLFPKLSVPRLSDNATSKNNPLSLLGEEFPLIGQINQDKLIEASRFFLHDLVGFLSKFGLPIIHKNADGYDYVVSWQPIKLINKKGMTVEFFQKNHWDQHQTEPEDLLVIFSSSLDEFLDSTLTDMVKYYNRLWSLDGPTLPLSQISQPIRDALKPLLASVQPILSKFGVDSWEDFWEHLRTNTICIFNNLEFTLNIFSDQADVIAIGDYLHIGTDDYHYHYYHQSDGFLILAIILLNDGKFEMIKFVPD